MGHNNLKGTLKFNLSNNLKKIPMNKNQKAPLKRRVAELLAAPSEATTMDQMFRVLPSVLRAAEAAGKRVFNLRAHCYNDNGISPRVILNLSASADRPESILIYWGKRGASVTYFDRRSPFCEANEVPRVVATMLAEREAREAS